MATSFPTSLDALTNPTGSDTLASPDHAGQHSDVNDAVEALQTKVGVDSSAVVTSLDYKVGLKVDKTLVDAKGDLIVASAADTVGRLAVGATDGHVLTVDSGEASGIKWAAAAGSGVNFGMDSGTYYAPFVTGTTTIAVLSQTCYTPFFVTESTTFDRMFIRGVSNSGTAVVRLGIYNSTNYEPSTVKLDAGTVSVTAAGYYEITISETLAAGMYWLAFNMQTAGSTNYYGGQSSNDWSRVSPYNPVDAAVAKPTFIESSVTGAFDTAVPVASSATQPLVTLRKA